MPTSLCPVVVRAPSYEAFWPEGSSGTWYNQDVYDTHWYEITDEPGDLANHSLLFWTAVALRLPLRGEGTPLLFIVLGEVA